jgi:hypothetical protein
MIVQVNANFARGKELFAILAKYAQESDGQFAYWDEFAFTASHLPETDALLIFNDPSEPIHVVCDPAKLIAFMMEPGDPRQHPWMFGAGGQYAKVFSPVDGHIPSHGYLGWYFEKDWAYLSNVPVPEKSLGISCIASNLKQLKGHRIRTAFVNMLRQQMPQVDFFGKGTHFLPDKLDGLLPYRFSVAIENSSADDYFTEKINDCFLAYTVPVYYGCRNISKYFPGKAFVQIDIEKPHTAIDTIRELLATNDWKQRLDAVKEARQLVLNKYQPLAGAAAILRELPASGSKQEISLEPFPLTAREKIKSFLKSLVGDAGKK